MTIIRVAAVLLICALGGTAAAAADLTIGVGAPLSGPDAIFGSQLKLGVDQAVADLKASGHPIAQHTRIVLGDDAGDPSKATEVAKTFVAQHVPVIIGHFSSAATVAASAIYAASGALEITPSSTAPAVTDRGLPDLFRICARDDTQAEVAARFLLQKRYVRVAIVHDRTDGGKRLADDVRRDLARAGLNDVLYNGIDKGTRDFSPLVNRLRASTAQVVFFGGGATEAGLLARQLRDANVRIALMGGNDLASDDFIVHAGNAAEGTMLVFPRDPKSRSGAAALLRHLRDAGGEPGAYVFYSYAATQVVMQAAERSGSVDPAKLAAELHGGRPFETILGSIGFDAKGDSNLSDNAIFVWHKGPSGRLTFDDPARV